MTRGLIVAGMLLVPASEIPEPREPLGLIEIDTMGNILVPAAADAVVTHDGAGEPSITGSDIRGTRCAKSVTAVMDRTDGPFTVICLPREYRLFEKIRGLNPTAEPPAEAL